MLVNATSTISLSDLDELRNTDKYHEQLKSGIRDCFDYSCEQIPHPPECGPCEHAAASNSVPNSKAKSKMGGYFMGELHDYCKKCEAWNNYDEYNEVLTVDIDRLIKATRDYALYGKDIEADLDEVQIVKKGAE